MAHKNGVTNYKSVPNWASLKPIADRSRFEANYRFLTEGTPCTQDQMMASPRRKRIPISDWENLVTFAIYAACIDWDPDKARACPLRNYAWKRLGYVALAYWERHEHVINELPKRLEQM